MKRKTVAIVLSVMLVLAFTSVAYAADKPTVPDSAAPDDVFSSGSDVFEVVETDPDVLARIAKEEGLVAPDGQELVGVKTTYVRLLTGDDVVSDGIAKQSVLPAATESISITNVRVTGYKYYSSDYDSYWYYGPYSLSATYGQTRNAGYSSSYPVSSSLVVITSYSIHYTKLYDPLLWIFLTTILML